MSAKVGPQILLRLRPRIVWADEGRGCGGFCPLRCFAALPRNLAPLWGWMEVLAVAAFYPVLWGWAPFRSSSLFLMLDEKPHVFAGVHTRLISA